MSKVLVLEDINLFSSESTEPVIETTTFQNNQINEVTQEFYGFVLVSLGIQIALLIVILISITLKR